MKTMTGFFVINNGRDLGFVFKSVFWNHKLHKKAIKAHDDAPSLLVTPLYMRCKHNARVRESVGIIYVSPTSGRDQMIIMEHQLRTYTPISYT